MITIAVVTIAPAIVVGLRVAALPIVTVRIAVIAVRVVERAEESPQRVVVAVVGVVMARVLWGGARRCRRMGTALVVALALRGGGGSGCRCRGEHGGAGHPRRRYEQGQLPSPRHTPS